MVSVPQLVDLLQVSEVTIRNDLKQLEKEGKLVRTHGGAVLGRLPRTRLERARRSLQDKSQIGHDGIHWIAQRAAALVNEGETILLFNSPIAHSMAEELLKLRVLTVLTNSLQLATTLQGNPANTVILLGGRLRSDGDTLAGPLANQAFETLRVQKAFVTCDGLTPALSQVDTAACRRSYGLEASGDLYCRSFSVRARARSHTRR